MNLVKPLEPSLKKHYYYISDSLGIGKALKKYGFAIIKDHGISKSMIKELFIKWEEFFSTEIKNVYTNKNTNVYSGYYDFLRPDRKSLYEAFYFNHSCFEHYENSHLFSQTSALINELQCLGEILLTSLLQYANLSNVEYLIPKKKSTLKILHYPTSNDPENLTLTRNYAHVDREIITLLPISNSMQGLEFLANDSWIEPEYLFGEIVINTGSVLTLLSNNFYKASMHRVKPATENELGTSRYSMAYFISNQGA